ncbi:MAG: LLM class flavin-dependent oxidoreductase [Candidatus Dormiibacterota bacterium]
MPSLAKQVGLGLAARGDVADTVDWARRAEDLGLESVWVHDSYFERDPITFLAAMARATSSIRLGAGALNPYTRHSFVVATTMASLDDIAPGRMSLALGSGLPLRLMQMAIPHEDAPAHVGRAIDDIRTLWRGERLVLNDKVPPLVPMFPPPRRIPIYVAAYTKPYLRLAGEKADGYLARPMESLPAFSLMREGVLASAAEHGRPATDIDFRGYLLTYVADSRREALNRAKREPFVIYMVSILSDASLRRAGFPAELRDEVNGMWRAEKYHEAAEAIPDELLEAFVLVGTRDDVARRAEEYHTAGMDVPLLQPVVQDEDQVRAVLDACVLYGSGVARAAAQGQPAARGEAAAAVGDTAWQRLRARAAGAYEITRPFSFTASLLPITAAGAFAWTQGRADLLPWLAALAGGLALHAGTNVVNEIYDVRHGIDSITSPRASHAIVSGGVSERGAFGIAYSLFAISALMGVYLTLVRGPLILVLGVLGLLGGYFYTAPPFHYKYRALGVPLVFLQMGVLMTVGAYFAATGAFDWRLLALAAPIGLLVAAILHGNEWRDMAEDTRLGFSTLSARIGKVSAFRAYVALVIGTYMVLAIAVIAGWLPTPTLLAVLSLPAAVLLVQAAERGAGGSLGEINMIDMATARLHAIFGVLLILGLIVAHLVA